MTNFNFSDIIEWDALSEAERTDILRRPAVMAGDKITAVVSGILDEVESRGDAALRDFSAKFDRTEVKNFKVSKAEVDAAISRLSPEFIKALQTAAKNIEKFHSAEVLETVTVETMPGVVCQQVTRPIGAVGLYIPGGTAPLFSTVLMLGIPAKIAGCSRVILCSPPPIADPILAAARLCGIDEIYQVGGAQAIAAMAFGTETIPSVSKIFGPGNAYVAAAKRYVFGTVGIDMIAGPSEILVICDGKTNPDWIAMDLFSQAEHDELAQAILLTDDAEFADKVAESIDRQIKGMSRKDIISASLNNRGAIIVTRSIEEACKVADTIAPEHLELSVQDADKYIDQIHHAGALFVGPYTCEALGDYCAGPNHVLPTSRTARYSSPLGVWDFQKRMSVLKVSKHGAEKLGRIADVLARGEFLTAHAASAMYRVHDLEKK